MYLRFLLLLSFLLSGSAFSQVTEAAKSPPQLPPPPPEVKKTLDAIVGEWAGLMTATVPGKEPETFPWFVECTMAALGAGAACTMKGEASIGPIVQACLLAYDPGSRAVHYMCVTSMGEVHDHKGQWTDDKTIEFEPLEGSMRGEPVIETVRWSFLDARTLNTRSVIALADGSLMAFEFTGTRQ